jgi:hypothetical protein
VADENEKEAIVEGKEEAIDAIIAIMKGCKCDKEAAIVLLKRGQAIILQAYDTVTEEEIQTELIRRA